MQATGKKRKTIPIAKGMINFVAFYFMERDIKHLAFERGFLPNIYFKNF
jgi:hypothetical protein